MKNKILALLISLGIVMVMFGVFLLLFFYPQFCYLYIGLSILFLIYQGYTFWLQKLNRKTNKYENKDNQKESDC